MLLAMSGCAASDRARMPPVVEPWAEGGDGATRIASARVEIYTSVQDAEFVEAVPGVLEDALDAFGAVLPVGDAQPRLTVYLFRSRGSWEHFCIQRWPVQEDVIRRISIGGYSDGDASAVFYSDRGTTWAALVHEAWHQYAASRTADLPGWLHEGLACSFEAIEWRVDRPRFGTARNTFRLNSLRGALEPGRWQGVSELLATSSRARMAGGDSRTVQEYYAQVWALVTYLRYGERGKYARRLTELLRDVGEGTARARVRAWRVTVGASDVDEDVALFRAYVADDLEQVDRELRRFALALCGV